MTQSQPPATPPITYNPRAKRRRRTLRTMGSFLFFVAASIGALAAISAVRQTASSSSPVTDNSASAAPANATGAIVLNPGAGCRNRIFDNRTGQISETDDPCPTEAPRDAKGVPIPLGTTKTINSISKSFNK